LKRRERRYEVMEGVERKKERRMSQKREYAKAHKKLNLNKEVRTYLL